MSKIILATNLDNFYYQKKHDDWIKSSLKNKEINMECYVFFVKNKEDKLPKSQLENVNFIEIDASTIKHSINKYCQGKRKNYMCLETGEFLNYCSFNDDDVIVMCDYDVTMQRKFTVKEIQTLNNLSIFEFACNSDCYSKVNWQLIKTYENCSKNGTLAFKDEVKDYWRSYNAGVQVAKVSAWKNLFESWKKVSNEFMMNMPHHFAFQTYFSSFLQKNNIVVEMPETFHNAHWFLHTKASVKKDDCLFVGDEKVLFFHHKFQKRPRY